MTRKLVVEADGGSRGNPGPAGYGALVTDAQTGEILAEVADSLGTTTNNVAEYSGLVAGLRAAGDLAPGADVQVKMDSKLVVEQMSGRWKIKDANLAALAASAREEAGRLGAISYIWVPRARNTRADRLANQAMDAARGDGGMDGNASASAGGTGRGADRRGRAGGRETIRSGGKNAGQSPVGADVQPTEAGAGWASGRGAATRMLLLRHGQTALSAERRFAGRGDVPLTEMGRQQAAAAAARLGARGGIDVIVSSPLRRARRTAEAAAEVTGAPLLIDGDLVEADFGKWEGLSFAEASERTPEQMTAWLASADAAPPGGESFAVAARRVLGALDRLLAAHPGRTLLIVSHVTPIKTLLCRALLAPPAAMFRIHLDLASLSEIDWFSDGPALVRSVNDTAHLP